MIQLHQAITAFLAFTAQTGKAATTQENYRHDLQLISRVLQRQSPGLLMTAITTAHLQDVVHAARVVLRADGRPRSLDAQLRLFICLRIFFHWAHRTGLCDTDPTLALAPPTSTPLPDTVILTEEAIACLRRVVWHASYPPALQARQAIMLEFLLTTGLHIQEIVHLNRTDLALAQCRVQVCLPRKPRRTVALTSRTCRYLEDYLAWRDAQPVAASEPALLLSARKGRLSAITVWHHLSVWGTWAHLPFRLTARLLHATFATRLFATTQDALVVMEAVGGRRSLAALMAIQPLDMTLREVVDAL
jgi:site-specific recombinase XerD